MAQLTSFLQQEFAELAQKNPMSKDAIEGFYKMPESVAMSNLEKRVEKIIPTIVMSHVMGVNLFTTLMATLANEMEMNLVTDIIDEINEEALNDD